MKVTHDGLVIHPRLLGGATWHTYADHRMAQAGALLGLVVEDVVVDDVACTDKTLPEFVPLWTQMLADSATESAAEIAADPDSEPACDLTVEPDHPVTSRGLYTDEHAEFERPRRRTRPRTKDHPDYSAAAIGVVITVDRGRYRLVVDDREVVATKARQLGRTGVIVGDEVRVVGDTSGDEGTLARIVAVEERRTVLRRTADDDDPYERPIVANADQLVIVTALADPPPRTGMIDRILVAGFDAGLAPLLCLTKADLASPDVLLAQYGPLDVAIAVTRPGADLTELRRTAGRSPQRLRRSLRRRQVDPGQRA